MIRLPISDTLAYRKLMVLGVMIRSMTGFRFPNWEGMNLAFDRSKQIAALARANWERTQAA